MACRPSLGLITIQTSWAIKAFFMKTSLLPLRETFCKYHYAAIPTSSVKHIRGTWPGQSVLFNLGVLLMCINHSASFLFHIPDTYTKSGKWGGKQMTTSLAFFLPLNPLKALYVIKRSFLPRESKRELNKTLMSISITTSPSSVPIYTPLPLCSLCREYRAFSDSPWLPLCRPSAPVGSLPKISMPVTYSF